MNPFLVKVLAILGIKRRRPQTKMGRIVRRCEHFVTITLLLYLGVAFYPQPLFGHQLEHEGITLYSTQPIPLHKGEVLLSQIRSDLGASEIHDEEQKFKVFLCNHKSLFTFLGPLSRDAFGFTSMASNIIIARADLESNKAMAYRDEHNARSLTAVVAHEIGHEMIKDEFGFLTAHTAPKWLNEGYCEYLSKESSFPEDLGVKMILEGKTHESKSFDYFVYRKMLEFYLDKKGQTINELFSSPPSEQDSRNQMRDWLSGSTH